jgi:hypothetical protein
MRQNKNLGLVKIKQSSVYPGHDVHIVAQQTTQVYYCWRLLSTYFKVVNSCILPQEPCIHSRIGAYTDKFHQWQCKDECRYLAQEKGRKQTSMIQAIQVQPIRGCHVGIHLIHDVLNPWEEDPMNQEPPRVSHGSYGPPTRPNRFNSTWAPGSP